MSGIDLERALNDPADLFESPDAVVHHPALTREQKVQILNNWQLDASRLEGSEARHEGRGRADAAPRARGARGPDGAGVRTTWCWPAGGSAGTR